MLAINIFSKAYGIACSQVTCQNGDSPLPVCPRSISGTGQYAKKIRKKVLPVRPETLLRKRKGKKQKHWLLQSFLRYM